MKITKRHLRKIIKEEVQSLLEGNPIGGFFADESSTMAVGPRPKIDYHDWAMAWLSHDGADDLVKWSRDSLAGAFRHLGFTDSDFQEFREADVLPSESEGSVKMKNYLKNNENFINGAIARVVNYYTGFDNNDKRKLPEWATRAIRAARKTIKGRELTRQDVVSSGILDKEPELKELAVAIGNLLSDLLHDATVFSEEASQRKAQYVDSKWTDSLRFIELVSGIYNNPHMPLESFKGYGAWKHWGQDLDLPSANTARKILQDYKNSGILKYRHNEAHPGAAFLETLAYWAKNGLGKYEKAFKTLLNSV